MYVDLRLSKEKKELTDKNLGLASTHLNKKSVMNINHKPYIKQLQCVTPRAFTASNIYKCKLNFRACIYSANIYYALNGHLQTV